MRLNYNARIVAILVLTAAVISQAVPACYGASDSPVVMKTKTLQSTQPVQIVITVGTSYLLPCAGLTKVAIGDPAVADVVPISTTTLLVNAKSVGSTNLYVWDRSSVSGLTAYAVRIVPAQADLAALAFKINDDIKGTGVSCRAVGDSVLLEGTVADPAVSLRAEAVATSYTKNVKNLVQIAKTASSTAMIAGCIQDACGTGITARSLTDGTILVEGKVSNQAEMDRLNTVLAIWGKETRVINMTQQMALPTRQIMIHAQVVEINRTDTQDLGVDWGNRSSSTGGAASSSDQPFIFGESGDGPFGIFKGGPIQRLNPLAAKINLLVGQNRAKILSEPNLLVSDGNTASILVGGEIPIPVVQSAGSGSTSVSIEWKEFGVRLGIKPTIGQDNMVMLDVAPEVSNLDFANAVQFSGFLIPAINSRKAQTIVQLKGGQSLLIGGLFSSEDRKNVRGIPILSKIPIIGEFFKTKSIDRLQTELVIIVTPEVIEPGQQPAGQSSATGMADEYRTSVPKMK